MFKRFVYGIIGVGLIIASVYLGKGSHGLWATVSGAAAGALLLGAFIKREKVRDDREKEAAVSEKIGNAYMALINMAKENVQASLELALATEQSAVIEKEISAAVSEISDNIGRQASFLEESANIAKELGSEVEQTILNSEAMAVASQDLKSATDKGRETMLSLKETFIENSIANEKVISEVCILSENSDKISSITGSITSITSQINLLALNASIEAARAGEAGRGFAVVAQEVRKLAEQSAASAGQITSIVKEIQGNIKSLQDKIESSAGLNKSIGENVELSNAAFGKLEEASAVLEENMEKVIFSLLEIENNKNVVVSNIINAAQMAQNIAAASEQVSTSAQDHQEEFSQMLKMKEKCKAASEKLAVYIQNNEGAFL